VNVHDDGENFYVEALAPGVDPAQLEITVVQNRLSIASEKRAAGDIAPERLHRVEWAAGRFIRTVDLPARPSYREVDGRARTRTGGDANRVAPRDLTHELSTGRRSDPTHNDHVGLRPAGFCGEVGLPSVASGGPIGMARRNRAPSL
jgi:hypothetical protein